MEKRNSPILTIQPSGTEYEAKLSKGGGAKEVRPVTRELRAELSTQLTNSLNTLRPSLDSWPGIPAVLRLTLHEKGLAKSNRPVHLLHKVGMDPIGAQRIGELLLPTNIDSIHSLSHLILTSNTKSDRANISAINSFEPYGISDVLRTDTIDEWSGLLTDWLAADKSLLVQLFEHDNAEINGLILNSFKKLLNSVDARIIEHRLQVLPAATFEIAVKDDASARVIAKFPAIRSLVRTPEFDSIDVVPHGFRTLRTADHDNLPPPDATIDHPVVGVLDTGVAPGNNLMTPWVTATETYELPPDTDYYHGTFVASLVAGGYTLNENNPRFPQERAKVVDASVISTSPTDVNTLMLRIEEVVTKYPEVKVWNCSFGTNEPITNGQFSPFAQALDALADERGILFVIAAGNYCTLPLREWPPTTTFAGDDRLSSPGDSVRALTVGSVAHIENLVPIDAPSPFSRKGPAPARVPKPEVTHYGGNCAADSTFDGTGIKALLPGNSVGESIGTSFSTPLVSLLSASTWHELEHSGSDAYPELVKVILPRLFGHPVKRINS